MDFKWVGLWPDKQQTFTPLSLGIGSYIDSVRQHQHLLIKPQKSSELYDGHKQAKPNHRQVDLGSKWYKRKGFKVLSLKITRYAGMEFYLWKASKLLYTINNNNSNNNYKNSIIIIIKHLDEIGTNVRVDLLQKAEPLGTVRILRKTLEI